MPNKYKRIEKKDRPKNISSMNVLVGGFFSVSYTMDVTNPHYTEIEYMRNRNIVNVWIEGKHTTLTEEEIISEILTPEEIIGMLKHEYEKGIYHGRNMTLNKLEKFVLQAEEKK